MTGHRHFKVISLHTIHSGILFQSYLVFVAVDHGLRRVELLTASVVAVAPAATSF